mmetsp:Transcript_20719/g.59002  ORF Transcript_20719/g.59002 Transcript_20719/m.59002 type:complete len:597 (-) Transcript_20719:188-1978(-)
MTLHGRLHDHLLTAFDVAIVPDEDDGGHEEHCDDEGGVHPRLPRGGHVVLLHRLRWVDVQRVGTVVRVEGDAAEAQEVRVFREGPELEGLVEVVVELAIVQVALSLEQDVPVHDLEGEALVARVLEDHLDVVGSARELPNLHVGVPEDVGSQESDHHVVLGARGRVFGGLYQGVPDRRGRRVGQLLAVLGLDDFGDEAGLGDDDALGVVGEPHLVGDGRDAGKVQVDVDVDRGDLPGRQHGAHPVRLGLVGVRDDEGAAGPDAPQVGHDLADGIDSDGGRFLEVSDDGIQPIMIFGGQGAPRLPVALLFPGEVTELPLVLLDLLLVGPALLHPAQVLDDVIFVVDAILREHHGDDGERREHAVSPGGRCTACEVGNRHLGPGALGGRQLGFHGGQLVEALHVAQHGHRHGVEGDEALPPVDLEGVQDAGGMVPKLEFELLHQALLAGGVHDGAEAARGDEQGAEDDDAQPADVLGFALGEHSRRLVRGARRGGAVVVAGAALLAAAPVLRVARDGGAVFDAFIVMAMAIVISGAVLAVGGGPVAGTLLLLLLVIVGNAAACIHHGVAALPSRHLRLLAGLGQLIVASLHDELGMVQ